MLSVRSLAWLVCLASACAPRSATWELGFEPDGLASRADVVEASILEGGCSGTRVLFRDRFSTAQGQIAPPVLGPGTYGFAGRARDARCRWYAAGCTEVVLPTAGVTVILREASEELDPTCGDGGVGDGGLGDDAGLSDADVVDPDGGPGDRDAGPLDDTACDDSLGGASFCSGFETSSLSDWAGTTTSGGGVAEWSSATPYRGAGAFHARVPAASARAEIAHDFAAPVASGGLHVRFYVRVTTPPSTSLDMLTLAPLGAPSMGFVVQLRAAGTALLVTAGSGAEVVASSDLPRDRWVCVQLDAVRRGERQRVALVRRRGGGDPRRDRHPRDERLLPPAGGRARLGLDEHLGRDVD